MKFLRKVLDYVAAAVADVLADEPVLVGSGATAAAVWAVGFLGLPATAVDIVRGAELAGAAFFVRHYVTPGRSPFLVEIEQAIDAALAKTATAARRSARR